jgi:hypothetical protein
MKAIKSLLMITAGAGAMFALAAAQRPNQRPAALAESSGGLWEISGAPDGKGLQRLCVGDTAVLAQFEHRAQMCTRLVISDTPPSAVIHYTCAGGGFGRSKMTLITPRSIRIETQGISDNLPFNYVIQARRVGDCPRR